MASRSAVDSFRRPITLTRHRSAIGQWETAVGPSAPALHSFAPVYVGWWEEIAAPLVRRELPTEYAPLIFSIGAPIRLYGSDDLRSYTDVGSFVTGAYDRSQLVGSLGPSGGVQINLTLLGIRRLVGRPLADLTNRAVSLNDVFGSDAPSWTARMADLRSWQERFEFVDRILAARLAIDSRIPPGVHAAWHGLVTSRGQVPIRSLARSIGWSQKHLIDRFRTELGLSPKGLARVLRFGSVVRALKSGPKTSLADLAVACGYYDQSHLNRDAREFAGVSPGDLVASLLPDQGGFVA